MLLYSALCKNPFGQVPGVEPILVESHEWHGRMMSVDWEGFMRMGSVTMSHIVSYLVFESLAEQFICSIKD